MREGHYDEKSGSAYVWHDVAYALSVIEQEASRVETRPRWLHAPLGDCLKMHKSTNALGLISLAAAIYVVLYLLGAALGWWTA